MLEKFKISLPIILARLTKGSQNRKLADEVEGLQQEMASIERQLHALRGQREQGENRLSELRSAIAKVEVKIAPEGSSPRTAPRLSPRARGSREAGIGHVCLSLGEPSTPNPDAYPEEDREFNRYTLLGEYDL